MRNDSVSIKELCYYLFFVLMIAAKGFGLDSGDKLYYLLSAFALFFVAGKLCLTAYTRKELVLVVLLCATGLIAFLNSGRPGILLSVLAVAGMKDMDIRKLFHLALFVFGISFFGTVLLAAGGILQNPLAVHEKTGIGEVIRWGMGYSTGNVFHISFFILVVLIGYRMGKNYDLKSMLLLSAGNLLVFIFSLSYTGVTVTFFYLFLNLYAVKRETLCRTEKILCCLPLPFCLLFSFVTPFLTHYPIGQKLNSLLQARPGFSYYYLTNQPITLFGARMRDVPNYWVIMDNGYVYFLMTFGVVAFLLFFGAYALLIKKYIKKSKSMELAILFSFLLYGIMEQFISNAFMNISVLFMGEILFGEKERMENQEEASSFWEKQAVFLPLFPKLSQKNISVWNQEMDNRLHTVLTRVQRKAKTIIGFGCAIGILLCGLYAFLDEKPEYVSVPVKALPYVDAQSLLLHTQKACADEKELKGVMEQYAETLRADAGEGKVSELLEFSLPQEVYAKKDYQTFRVRLLKGIYGVQDEDYRNFLVKMMEDTQEIQEQLGLYHDAVYEERIGKDFGTDRIEHIKDSEKYMIEKSGNIVIWEIYRQGIIRFLYGMVLGILVASVIFAGKDKKAKRSEK